MKIPVRYLSLNKETPNKNYWDMRMIQDLFAGKWARDPHGYEYEEVDHDEFDGGIIVFPARAQIEQFDLLQEYIMGLKWCIVMFTGDEEALFPFEKLQHPNMHLYVMSPRKGDRYANVSFLGTGYAPAIDHLPKEKPDKVYDYFFAGQVTHERRHQMRQAIEDIQATTKLNGLYFPTDSFTSGLTPSKYIKQLAMAKVAYCPSGPETPDTFRLFEALEAGCVPIADTRIPSEKDNGQFGDDYWEYFFNDSVPFPVIRDYDNLKGYTLDVLENYDRFSVEVASWWMKTKHRWATELSDHIHRLSGLEPIMTEDVTVLMPTSPISAHPSTEVIDKTIDDTMGHFKQPAQLIIMADGLRDHTYASEYNEYLRRLIWKCNISNKPRLVLTHAEHEHQARMTREALGYVTTKTILFVEHDAPLVPDYEFDFVRLTQPILKGEANAIRFHHEAKVLDEHRHLMLELPQMVCGVPLWRTRQWSQRPHLANAEFYRTMLNTYFDPEARTMIEDVFHGVVDSKVEDSGMMAWYEFRLWMYYPAITDKTANIKRSYHLDARGGDKKVIDADTVVDL